MSKQLLEEAPALALDLLGLLIDRKSRLVYLYRPDQPVEKLDDPAGVTCEPVLPDFVLSMKDIW